MSRRPLPSLADYVVIAISPVLIMLLVGSLVFFLIEVFYAGDYDGRLNFIMALFVMAAVLIARIAIESGRAYATLFAIPLGIVTAVATLRFVEFRGPLQGFSTLINLGLIALIWWCAEKLTWDSTVIDESQDASAEGLLQTVGLDAGDLPGDRLPSADAATSRGKEERSPWQKFLDARRRSHPPGAWVIYFSLAALPIFGFGNWFVPSADLDGRRYAFQLLMLYVASALGLLMTTSFLGLRRYLRQRRIEMPMEMAARWLGTGALLIVVLLALCLVLPRRNPEYSLTHLPAFAGSPTDLWTTEHAVGSEGQEDAERADRTGEKDGDSGTAGRSAGAQQDSSNAPSQPGQPGGSQGRSGEKGSAGHETSQHGSSPASSAKSAAQDESAGSEKSSSQPDPSSEQASDEAGQPSTGKSAPDSASQQESSRSDQREPRPPDAKQASSRASSEERDAAQQRQNDERNGRPANPPAARNSSQREASPRSRTRFDPSKLGGALGGLFGRLMRLLYWLTALLVIGFLAWRYHREIAAAIRQFLESLRAFWESLWRRDSSESEPEQSVVSAVPAAPPFSSYANPFLTGMVQQRSPEEVIRYSFEALEAWGREQGFPRDAQQTPHEYASVLARHQAGLARDVATLADLYCRCAYGNHSATRSSLERLRTLWEQWQPGIT